MALAEKPSFAISGASRPDLLALNCFFGFRSRRPKVTIVAPAGVLHACRLSEIAKTLGDQRCPAGLMAGAEAATVFPVEILVKEHEVAPRIVVRVLILPIVTRSLAIRIRQKMCANRLRSSWATFISVIRVPDPVGHSTCNVSP